MYRDGKPIVTHLEHRFILNHGALGDVICSLPAIVQAMRSAVGIKLMVYVADWQMPLIECLLKPYGEIEVCSIREVPVTHKDRLEQWGNGASNSLNAPPFNVHTRNRVHMVDFAFNFLLDARPESMLQRSYPTEAPLGSRQIVGKYVVIPTGATSDNKLFRASVMAPVLEWLLSQGYLPVLVGTKVSHTHAEMGGGQTEQLVIRDEVARLPASLLAKCCDLREKTALLELRDLLGHADAVVGVDGGTLHLAGTTDTNIIYAAGTTLPKHRYVARNGDPSHKIRYVGPRDLECAGCQSNWPLSRLDFRFCAYEDNKCMEMLHPDDFIEGLKELGL